MTTDPRLKQVHARAAIAAAIVLAAGACAPPNGTVPSPSGTPTPAASQAAVSSVKLGFLSPTTGFLSALGIDMRRGWELYWEQNGTSVGGTTVELVFEDDTADPDVALAKARRLVEEEQVDVMAGPITAATAYAVADYVAGQGIPSFHISGADDLTQRRFDPLVMRVGYTSSQSNFPAGQWAFDQGYKTAITVCADYAFGWESCGGFVQAFVDAGGTITDQLWPPLGNQDFSSYVTQIQAASPDAVFIGSPGGPDAILFYQAWLDFGLKDEIPLIGNCCFADQVLIRDLGADSLAIKSFSYWVEGRESPVVQAFVQDYEAKYGEIPSLYSAGSYLMAEVIANALEKTGGRVEGAAFVEAARQLTLEDSVYGPITFDDTNNIIGPVYLEEVAERADGKLWNVVESTYPDVSQFWTYGKDAFLQQPVFSRDFTGQ
jgi:branched-chain amino acid transport system substrate-binding protein